ncbi:MAG: hypothetical protein CSA62_04220 [Planctomycetota bacterium]|nr:MAG: hypothetical protein CSA62_04220 [Planctomycetota bacterium]
MRKLVRAQGLGLALLGMLLAPSALTQKPAGPGPEPEPGTQQREEPGSKEQGQSQTLVPGIFGELSRELSKLRRSSRFGVRITRDKTGNVMAGLHLGEGLIAAPWSADRPCGCRATVYSGRRIYRALKIGEIPRFLGLYMLRDRAHIDALPSPKRFFADADQGGLGDLCLVLDPMRARMSFLHERRYRRTRRAAAAQKGDASAGKLPPEVFAYGLADSESRAGSGVVAADGSLVGVLVRPEVPQSTTTAKKDGAKPAKESEAERAERKRRASFAMVLDGKMLWILCRKRAALFDMRKVPPSIGVRLNPIARVRKRVRPEGSASEAKPSREQPKAQAAPGFVVTSVYSGSPAERAGVRRLDRWLLLDGKPIESVDQVRAALAKLKPGGKLLVGYQRRGKNLKLEIWPD